eukprot:15918-Heterococcus_DN1.PRE.1
MGTHKFLCSSSCSDRLLHHHSAPAKRPRMASKIKRDEAIKLFKYLREVSIRVNPWNTPQNKGAWEFYRRMDSPAHKLANAKCVFRPDITLEPTWPIASVKFVDGSTMEWNTRQLDSQQCIEHCRTIVLASAAMNADHQHLYLAKAQQIDADFEVAGKNIDDVA